MTGLVETSADSSKKRIAGFIWFENAVAAQPGMVCVDRLFSGDCGSVERGDWATQVAIL